MKDENNGITMKPTMITDNTARNIGTTRLFFCFLFFIIRIKCKKYINLVVKIKSIKLLNLRMISVPSFWMRG